LTFVSHLREDEEITREFAHNASCSGGALHCKPEHLSAQECLLSPNVCFHCYGWLAGRDLTAPLTITACGKCFRYESKNLTGLERLWDFTMREIIFVGPAEWVLAEREKAIEKVLELMERWGLACEIRSANDPFFTDDFATMATYQQAFDLKFELLLPLPYKNKNLAVGSFNSHQDFFGRVFQITHQGQTAYTTCVGFGLERLLLAFLAQYGTDRTSWPRQFR
jgi:seryl-tRNA synthetase